MIRFILVFLILFALFYVGIASYHSMTNKEKLELSKAIVYSSVCALCSVGTLAAFVLLF